MQYLQQIPIRNTFRLCHFICNRPLVRSQSGVFQDKGFLRFSWQKELTEEGRCVTGCLSSYLTYLLPSQWRKDLAFNQVGDIGSYLIFSCCVVERKSRQKISAINTNFTHEHTHTHTNTRAHTHTHTQNAHTARTHTHTRAHTRAHANTNMRTLTQISKQTLTQKHIHAHPHTHVTTHTHTYTRMHAHIWCEGHKCILLPLFQCKRKLVLYFWHFQIYIEKRNFGRR
jgi:hypothetical protein